MREEYSERMDGLVRLEEIHGYIRLYDRPYESFFNGIDDRKEISIAANMPEQALYMLASKEARELSEEERTRLQGWEETDDDSEKSAERKRRWEKGLVEEEFKRLVFEGMLRVIDDRRDDPSYMAALDPKARKFLEDPYEEICSERNIELEKAKKLSHAWGDKGSNPQE